MKPHEFHDATVAAIRGRSWSDARREVAASLSLADAGEMLAAAEQMQHDAMEVLLEKLRVLGAQGYLRGRCYEVRLEVWWYIAPVGVCWCPDAQPSADGRDWLATDDPDLAAPEAERVQALADDVTLVLTASEGALVFRTSKRVNP